MQSNNEKHKQEGAICKIDSTFFLSLVCSSKQNHTGDFFLKKHLTLVCPELNVPIPTPQPPK